MMFDNPYDKPRVPWAIGTVIVLTGSHRKRGRYGFVWHFRPDWSPGVGARTRYTIKEIDPNTGKGFECPIERCDVIHCPVCSIDVWENEFVLMSARDHEYYQEIGMLDMDAIRQSIPRS